MSYLSPNLTNLIAAVKKSAASLDRDFSEIERLQSSVKDYKNFVMNGYNKVERTLKIELSKLRPAYVFAEDNKPRPQGGYFVVSPLSGLMNFVHGIPYFSVTAAICENATTIAAVVYNPARDELFFAEKGMGAYKEGFRSHERLRVSARKEVSEAVIGVSASWHNEAINEYTLLQNKVAASAAACRNFGDPALDLAYAAAGKLDAFAGYALKPSDITAGMLLVKEAGGYIYDINQKDIRTEDLAAVIASGDVLAVNGNLSNKLYDLLNK